MADDPIERSLERAERGEVGGTMQEQRREFQRPVTRPDDRPMAGQTFMERAKSAFFGPRKADRDHRKESR